MRWPQDLNFNKGQYDKGDKMVAVSIVSHGHGPMVTGLIAQLLGYPEISQIVITKNIPEELVIPASPIIHVIENASPKGFGENHNFAFSKIEGKYFCPLNPDIRLLNNPFSQFIENIEKYNADLIAPLVLNSQGEIEDSIRYFPSILSLCKKILFNSQGRYKFNKDSITFSPEWVAGMTMFFRSSSYKKLSGFDERYFLYYEDVDICVRLWRLGMKLVVNPSIYVVHDARRTSRRSIFYMRLHIQSMLYYFYMHLGRLPRFQSLERND